MRTALVVSASLLVASPVFAGKKPNKKPPAVMVADARGKPEAKPPESKPPVAAPAPADAKPTAKEVVARMQKFYEQTTDLHAKFDQELSASIGGKKKASGDVWLKKPGRMRWEYTKPEKKLMVADGTTLWVYEPEDEQAFRQPMNAANNALPSSVTFLFGTGRLESEFTITEDKPAEGAGEPGDVVLKLVPIKPTAQYRFLYFVVDPKSYMVKESLVYDQQGGVNRMRFRDIETNKGLGNAKFEFTPPEGTKIIKP